MASERKYVQSYPGNIFDSIESHRVGRLWQVLQLKHNSVKTAALQLEGRGIPFFCPFVPRESQWSDRKVTVFDPLFGDYIFVLGTERERKDSIQVSGVWNTIRGDAVGDQNLLTTELVQIHTVTKSAPRVFPVAPRDPKGRKVRIVRGIFDGICGTIVEVRSTWRFVIGVAAFGLSTSIEISDGDFQYLD